MKDVAGALGRKLDPRAELVMLVRAAIDDEQHFGALLGQRRRRPGRPHILADHDAEPGAAKFERALPPAGGEDALLVEYPIIGQIELEDAARDTAGIEQQGGVIELALLDPGAADQDGRASIGRRRRELFHPFAAAPLKGGLQDQILRRIAGNDQFAGDHQWRAGGRRLAARLQELFRIALDVAHGRVELGEGEHQTLVHDGKRDTTAGLD